MLNSVFVLKQNEIIDFFLLINTIVYIDTFVCNNIQLINGDKYLSVSKY